MILIFAIIVKNEITPKKRTYQYGFLQADMSVFFDETET